MQTLERALELGCNFFDTSKSTVTHAWHNARVTKCMWRWHSRKADMCTTH